MTLQGGRTSAYGMTVPTTKGSLLVLAASLSELIPIRMFVPICAVTAAALAGRRADQGGDNSKPPLAVRAF
jgi:hypothetical protein